jgi:hypothetical protein
MIKPPKEWTKSDTITLAARVMGKLGGLARSHRKTAANRANARKPRDLVRKLIDDQTV